MSSEIKMKLPDDCPIKPKWFYHTKNEKIKFVWFLYEYACAYYNAIMDSQNKQVKQWTKSQNSMELAGYCAYFSKRLRKDLIEYIEDISSDVICDAGYIEDYCHLNNRKLNLELAFLAQSALIGLLEICNTCPMHCLDDAGGHCSLFDRYI